MWFITYKFQPKSTIIIAKDVCLRLLSLLYLVNRYKRKLRVWTFEIVVVSILVPFSTNLPFCCTSSIEDDSILIWMLPGRVFGWSWSPVISPHIDTIILTIRTLTYINEFAIMHWKKISCNIADNNLWLTFLSLKSPHCVTGLFKK